MEMILEGDLYRIFRDVKSKYGLSGFLQLYPFDKVKEYYNNRNTNIDYRYFVCLFENEDINRIINYYKNNESFIHELIVNSDSMYSLFSSVNSESIRILFNYLENHTKEYDDFIMVLETLNPTELLRYTSTIKEDKIILMLLKENDPFYKEFVNNDLRAIDYINNKEIKIKIVEYPENLKRNINIFNGLKDKTLVDFRNNIEKYIELNKDYYFEEKFEKYEDDLINSFNPNKNIFQFYEENLENIKDDKYLFENFNYGISKEEISIKKLNELIIDRLFKDNYHNVILNIKELLRYNKDNINSLEYIDLYNKVLDFKNLSSEEKIDLYNTYKDQRIYTKFYLEIDKCKKELYKDIKNNLYKPIVLEKYLSNKYGTDVYYLNGEKFNMLIRTLNTIYTDEHTNLRRECFSLINSQNTSRFDGEYVYGYLDFSTDRIISTNENDAFSGYEGSSNYVNRLMTSDELTKTHNYNEIQIKTNKEPIKPSYIVAFNEITEKEVSESKRLNIPIVLINEKKYNKEKLDEGMFRNDREKYVYNSYQEQEEEMREKYASR